MKELLLLASDKYPDVHKQVTDAVKVAFKRIDDGLEARAEAARKADTRTQDTVLTFADEPAFVWDKVNANREIDKYEDGFYELVFEGKEYIDATIEKILKLAKVHANPGTRFNVLHVLCKMGMTIFESAGTGLASGVRNDYTWSNLSCVMYDIVLLMPIQEIRNIYLSSNVSPDVKLFEELKELQKQSEAYAVFTFSSGISMDDVIRMITKLAEQ